jgi:hypothetical protein
MTASSLLILSSCAEINLSRSEIFYFWSCMVATWVAMVAAWPAMVAAWAAVVAYSLEIVDFWSSKIFVTLEFLRPRITSRLFFPTSAEANFLNLSATLAL